jgi:hypothetical protein
MRTRAASRVIAAGIGLLVVGAAAPASAHSKSISAASLKSLTSSINNVKHLTYEAEYKSVNSGQTETVTIAQSPPKSNFSSSGGSVINDGKKTYYCSTQNGSQTCLSTGVANPFTSLEDLFSPEAAAAAFSEAKAGLISKALGIKVSASSATIAGQASTCVSVTVKGKGGKYCVNKQGILSYSGSSSTNYFELVKYTKSPPRSLFSLPAGATTVTLPGGDSIP